MRIGETNAAKLPTLALNYNNGKEQHMDELKTEGVVLKRTYVGEKDAIIKILTKDAGLVSASVKGIKNMKSKLAAGCRAFSYSDFVLKPGKDFCIVAQSVQKEGFFGLSSNIERLSYAAYFADLTTAFSPSADDARAVLPLLLNTLFLLANSGKNMALIKCVFELRLLCALGFSPFLDGCASCGSTDALPFFSPLSGGTICKSCSAPDACIMPENTLTAMRYAKESNDKKAFSFTLPQSAIDAFARCTEKMCEAVLGRQLPSLSYLKQMTGKL